MIIQKTTTAWITQTFDNGNLNASRRLISQTVTTSDQVDWEDAETGDPINPTEELEVECSDELDFSSLERVEGDADQDGSIVTALEVIRSMGLTPEQLGELINCLLNGGLPRK